MLIILNCYYCYTHLPCAPHYVSHLNVHLMMDDVRVQFDFALAVARIALPQKIDHVQRQLAVHLQASGRWREAEMAFIKVKQKRPYSDAYTYIYYYC